MAYLSLSRHNRVSQAGKCQVCAPSFGLDALQLPSALCLRASQLRPQLWVFFLSSIWHAASIIYRPVDWCSLHFDTTRPLDPGRLKHPPGGPLVKRSELSLSAAIHPHTYVSRAELSALCLAGIALRVLDADQPLRMSSHSSVQSSLGHSEYLVYLSTSPYCRRPTSHFRAIPSGCSLYTLRRCSKHWQTIKACHGGVCFR